MHKNFRSVLEEYTLSSNDRKKEQVINENRSKYSYFLGK